MFLKIKKYGEGLPQTQLCCFNKKVRVALARVPWRCLSVFCDGCYLAKKLKDHVTHFCEVSDANPRNTVDHTCFVVWFLQKRFFWFLFVIISYFTRSTYFCFKIFSSRASKNDQKRSTHAHILGFACYKSIRTDPMKSA